MSEKSTIAHDFTQQGIDFLKVELQTGLTFANLALMAEPGSEDRVREQANALKAYQTVLRLRGRLQSPNEAAVRQIQNALDQLRSVLEKLGENVSSGT